MPMYRKVNKDFFKKWTPEMAYVLGFFMADGYVTHNRRGASFFCFQICDLDILRKIKTLLDSEHKISKRIHHNPHDSIQYRLQIGNKEMCEDLSHLGVEAGKARNLKIPPTMPSHVFPHFVRGYFDGDGNVWAGLMHKKRKSPTRTLISMFTSCSDDFLKNLLLRLQKSGIIGGSIYRSKKNYSRLQLSTNDSLKLYNFMYNQSNQFKIQLFLPRKKRIFEEYVKLKDAAVV